MLQNALSNPICEYATGIALAIFLLKHIWALDLELLADREEQRARLHAAREKTEPLHRDADDDDPNDASRGD
jgi:hypothetical protein